MELEFTLEQIDKTADAFWTIAGMQKIIAFHGAMGAGKTTFIHALCDAKKVKESVTSPTFSIINEYTWDSDHVQNIIFHMDLYRINSEEEAVQAGVQDCLYSGNICLVEWPEKAASLFPPESMHVYLEVLNQNTRRLTVRQ